MIFILFLKQTSIMDDIIPVSEAMVIFCMFHGLIDFAICVLICYVLHYSIIPIH